MIAEIFKYVFSMFFAFVAYSILHALYNVTLHPLAKLPGPPLRAAFYFPFFHEIWTGDIAHNWHHLHEKYGPVVRISPTHVSFTGAEAWKDIYGQTANKKALRKDPEVYAPPPDGVVNINSANDTDHARIRRLFSHGFSPSALKRQEHIVDSYITILMQKLQEKASSGNMPVDLVRWFNFTTFDIIGDLCFGESFDALKNEDYHFWMANIFRGLKFVRMFRVLRAYPIVGWPLLKLMTLFPALQKARQKHMEFTEDRTARRLDTKTSREDVMSHILKHNDERGMTRAEIIKTNATVLMAGSDSPATLLSGVTFLLLKNRSWLIKLQEEVRSLSLSELTFTSLSKLQILNAVIQESIRVYPPVPTILPRLTPKEGALIDGVWISGDTGVGVAQYPANMSSRNFTNPDTFAPERWLGDKQYENDALSAVQGFSLGPRNCLGQPLALAEVKAILARLVWNFDMELDERSADWSHQKVFIVWEKHSLLVKLTPRVLESE